MAASTLRREDYAGLAVAIAAHAGLAALLVLRPPSPPLIPPVERVTVTLSDETGLTSTSPEPMAEAAPDTASELGEAPAPEPMAAPEPLSQPQPVPKPLPKPMPKPEPREAPPPRPQPSAAKPEPRPAPRASPAARPSPRPSPRATAAPPRPRAKAATKAATPPRAPATAASRPSPRASAAPTTRTAGASRIGDDFLSGVPNARATGTSRNPPAAAIGPAVTSALSGAISRQLKPRWVAPQGVDAEKLVTILTWNLNPDGTLAGAPRVVRQDGITDANRPQAARHAEQAIRAVQLAAPFTLPAEYYDAWKRVAQFRFDKRLSQ